MRAQKGQILLEAAFWLFPLAALCFGAVSVLGLGFQRRAHEYNSALYARQQLRKEVHEPRSELFLEY